MKAPVLLLVFGTFLFSAALTNAQTVTNVITPGSMNIDATFNSIGIEVFFTGDDNANAKATLQFKKSSDSTWRKGLDLWRTDGSTFSDGRITNDIYGRTFYGSVLQTDPGTSYDIQVTIQDADGVSGNSVLTQTVTTRAENIPDPTNLTPTYFVDAIQGNDANSGTSSNTPWKTLQHAWISAPSNAIVQFAPGFYSTPTISRNNPITLKAQYPSVTYDSTTKTWTESSISQHSIIDSGIVIGPAGATDAPYTNVWQQITLPGPGYTDNGGTIKNYTIWKWANTPFTKLPDSSNTMFVGYATARVNEPQRLPYWENTSSQNIPEMGTPAAWAEKVFTNKSYNYGATLFSNGSGGYDMYVRLPNDSNPNSFYITSEQNYVNGSIAFTSSNNRISGFDLHLVSIIGNPGSNFNIMDHNKVVMGAFLTNGNVGPAPSYQPSSYSNDNVVEYNLFKDSDQRTATAFGSGPFPWNFVKGYIVNADGTKYGYRIGGMAELGPIDGRGTGRREVFRFNEVDGFHDGPHTGYNPDFDRYANEGMDIDDNYIHNIADDALETGDADINIRMWNNRVEKSSVFESIHFSNFGPIYFFRNTGWEIGTDGMKDSGDGIFGVAGLGIKYDTASTVNFRNYFINNTLWTNAQNQTAGGSTTNNGALAPDLYFRNNIIRVSERTFDINGSNVPLFTGKFSDENDWWATQNTNNFGMRWGIDYINPVDYKAASGTGTNTNSLQNIDYLFSDFIFVDNALTDPVNGNLTLKTGSPFIDEGVIVPNISDTGKFAGSAPDLGATEYGMNGVTPSPTSTFGNGDANGDGLVNIADIKAILQNWLAFVTNSLDQYGDGRINTLDFVQVVNHLP